MKRITTAVMVFCLLALFAGCGQDREHPTPTTEADRLMESYLANVQKIGRELSTVQNTADAQSASARILLIVSDMRDLRDRMEAVSDKDQADTMSKYRVKISKVNEAFAKEVARFAAIPGASEELIALLKSMPDFGKTVDDPARSGL